MGARQINNYKEEVKEDKEDLNMSRGGNEPRRMPRRMPRRRKQYVPKSNGDTACWCVVGTLTLEETFMSDGNDLTSSTSPMVLVRLLGGLGSSSSARARSSG